MAEPIRVDNGTLTDYDVLVDDVVDATLGSGAKQIVGLADGTIGSTTKIAAGGGVEAGALRVTVASDSTGVLSVDDNGATLSVDDGGGALTVDGTVSVSGAVDTELTTADLDTGAGTDTRAVVGLAGTASGGAALIASGGGTEATALRVTVATDSTGVLSVDDNGSTLSVDDGAGSLTVDNAALAVVGGGVEATALRVTLASDSTGLVSVDDNGGSLTVDGTVTVTDGLNVEGDVAHDAGDSGNPVKVGAKAHNALPTAVANNDRTNNISDLFGRQLYSHIDPGMQTWKSASYTTTQTGAIIWDPAAGKRIAIQYLAVSSYATTGGRVILWFGATADATYTAGTDQLVWAGSFAPSASAKPGMVLPLGISPIFSVTADHELKITTDAGVSLDVTVYGYEF